MKLKYLGHACFLATASDGTTVVMDPYRSGAFGNAIRHAPVRVAADVVLTSHSHDDHGYTGDIEGKPTVIGKQGSHSVKSIKFKGVAAFHDTEGGSERGANVIFCFTMDGVRVCHCGDLGHVPTDDQVEQIGPVDVLLVPVGGFFTIDAGGAGQVMQKLKPAITIPMHYKTSKVNLPISSADDFLKGKPNVRRLDAFEIEITAQSLPAQPEILVLPPAL